MDLLLAVDGGNSKTIALVGRPDGMIVGWGRGGCSDIYAAASPGLAFAEVERAVGHALEYAARHRNGIAGGVFSMAGADWPENIEFATHGDAQDL
jgi:N-acetylglucosamine kinase-like BadF-type ATPase